MAIATAEPLAREPFDRTKLLVAAGGAVHGVAVHLPVPLRAVRSFAPKEGGALANYAHFFTTDNLYPTIWIDVEARAARATLDQRRLRAADRIQDARQDALPALGDDDPGRADHARHRADRRGHADLLRARRAGSRSSCSSFICTTDRSGSRTTTSGVLISLVVSGFPFAFLLILSYVTGIDPGARARRAPRSAPDPQAQFRHIYLPLLAPGLAMCFCLVVRAGVLGVSVRGAARLAGRSDAGHLDRRVRGRVRAVRLFARVGDRDDHGLRPAHHRGGRAGLAQPVLSRPGRRRQG